MTKSRCLILRLVFAGCAMLLSVSGQGQPAQLSPPLPALTQAQQVLELGLDTARHTVMPVRLQGLITYADPAANLFYLADESGGVRVVYTNAGFFPVSGQAVIVEGMAAAGSFAPFIDCASVQFSGYGPIPQACEAPAARLAAGEMSGQWVQIEGVIRDIAKEPDRALLFVSSAGMRFHGVIQPFTGTALPQDWIDARVLLRGVCWTDVDAESKPVGFTLFVPGTNQLFFLRPGKRDIFLEPALPLNHPELRRQSDNRVRITATVVFHSLSGYLYLRDAEGNTALRARLLVPLSLGSRQTTYLERPVLEPLMPGDQVELVGAPTAAVFAPQLQDAEYRVIGKSTAPLPQSIRAEDAFSGKFDGHLVSLRGRLLASETRQSGKLKHQALALQSGETIFEALWEFNGTNALRPLPKNSYVEATGICSLQLGELNQVRSIRLLLRDPNDLVFLGRAPWWESIPLGKMVAIGLSLVLLAACWIWSLRRRVFQRTLALQAEVTERQRAQSELRHALAAERELGELRQRFVSMVSHEFRTPLGVIMSSAENLSCYFDRLTSDQRQKQLRHVIEATSHMAKVMENVLLLGRVEAGKMEFEPSLLDLPAFCRTLIEGIQAAATETGPQIEFQAQGVARAWADEKLLRHILNNLLTNAVKYAPGHVPVKLSLEQRNGEIIFRVQDQGIGIPAEDQKQLFNAFHRGRNTTAFPGTGLGLVIVKRCVELHGGEITFQSAENAGTVFTVRLPFVASAMAAARG
jgi:signal transduction histidine kinase